MDPRDDVQDAVVLASDAATRLRARLNVPEGRALRLAFQAGPGDAVGTFEQWATGCHDARVPVLSYSGQFYSLVAALGAEALVLTETPEQPDRPDPRICFRHVPRARSARGVAWHFAEHDYARRLATAIADWGPDAIILGGDLKPAAYHAMTRTAPFFLTLHSTFWPMGKRPRDLRSRARQWRLGRALAQAAGAVCTSRECARQFDTLAGPGQMREVEMPQIRAGHLYPLRRRSRARQVLFLGRIEVNKGVFDLVTAFGALAAQFADARLVLAGTGSAAAALADLVARHPARGQIEIAGQLDAEGVHAALDAADLLVCPTRSEFAEGLALVVLEAVAQGVPALASSVVPAAETAGAACMTFPADDTDALQAMLRQLMTDDAAYAARACDVARIRARMLDRSLGWGSCLARVLAG